MYDGSIKKLVQVIQDLSAVRTLDEVMAIVRTTAREFAQADGATFVLRDNDMCFYADEDAIAPLWKGQRFPMVNCISGWAMLNKQSVLIEDIYQDPRIPHDAYRPTFVKSLAITPIRKESPIGVIGTYWKDQHTPSKEQLDLLQALADSVSVALENLNLYSSLQSRIEDLKSANRAKDEFLMTVSHELRTPLNAILGWSEILLEANSDPAENKLGLETIERNAKNQMRIVEDLLDSSRIISGNFQLEKVQVDIVKVVKEVINDISLQAQRKKLSIVFNSEIDCALVFADPERIKQVVNNILVNGIKFSSPQNILIVDISVKGPTLKISCKDFGEGIEPELIPVIFDRFRQADSSLTRKYGGLGLGLSIARYLSEAHKGSLQVESPGKGLGSTFTISLPLLEATTTKIDGTTKVSSSGQAKPLAGTNILVIDDDEDCLTVVATALRMNGAEVQCADSVNGALNLPEEYKPQMIVCDLSMPDEDGFSFVDKIRQGKTRFEHNIPMMALSAFADKGNEKKALHQGFNLFVGKPVGVSQLIKSLIHLKSV